MGQYYYVVNLDKREFLHPHKLGDGLKFGGWAGSDNGTMLALGFLLADNEDRKGSGRWAGDRIIAIGDYGKHRDIYEACAKCEETPGEWKDISLETRAAVEASCQWAKFGRRWDVA